MKLFSLRHFIFLGLAALTLVIAACSSSSSDTGAGTTTSAFGLPKVEMKCNGQDCIQ